MLHIPIMVVDLARWEFAIVALFHFLFVPLTLGLSFLLFTMELVYVVTGKEIWRDMVKFWGVLFGINFAIGVATGLTMEFQFGLNWAYYSHYVGDIFGAPLAIEGLMAFFLESTFVGLFFFGWNRMGKKAHLAATGLVAIGSNFSALWILIANGWMQHPVGTAFNIAAHRMELTNFVAVLGNNFAQDKFAHTVLAGYTLGATFVIGVSAFYLLSKKFRPLALRSIALASAFGLMAICFTILLGDQSGIAVAKGQQMKMAAIEAQWTTATPPAPWFLIAAPDNATHVNHAVVEIPYLLSIIGTRSLTKPVIGIDELVKQNTVKVQDGALAVEAVQILDKDPTNAKAMAQYNTYKSDMGYGLLLEEYAPSLKAATPAEIQQAAWGTVPNVWAVFWSFRVMMAIGFWLFFVFLVTVWKTWRRTLTKSRGWLWVMLLTLPLPWIAVECGWLVNELGRQPWTVYGILPTFYSVSHINLADITTSLTVFIVLYTTLAIVEVFVMLKAIRKGPEAVLGHKPGTGGKTKSPAKGG